MLTHNRTTGTSSGYFASYPFGGFKPSKAFALNLDRYLDDFARALSYAADAMAGVEANDLLAVLFFTLLLHLYDLTGYLVAQSPVAISEEDELYVPWAALAAASAVGAWVRSVVVAGAIEPVPPALYPYREAPLVKAERSTREALHAEADHVRMADDWVTTWAPVIINLCFSAAVILLLAALLFALLTSDEGTAARARARARWASLRWWR